MKIYQNEQHGFEIETPEEWSFHSQDETAHTLIFKCSANEAFNIQIAPLTRNPSPDQTENEFKQLAREKGYTSLGLGRIKVGGEEHVWARYYMGGGLWSKKYMIVLNEIEFAITATCLDQKVLLEMEKSWDGVAASFRLMSPADKSANPKREVSEQKNEIADVKPRQDLKNSKITNPSLETTIFMQMLSLPARLGDMPQRIEMCQQALTKISRQTNPEEWAALELELGISFGKNPFGNRDENIEQSIQHYLKAQEVFTRQAYPDEWANIQTNLASDYRNRRRGDHDENVEAAINLSEEALGAITQAVLPELKASIHNNLANAYRDRIRGKKDENLKRAIFHCQQALAVMTRQRNPHYWAMIQNNLGNIYQDYMHGERAENIGKSIYHYGQALEVFTRKGNPEDWAWTHSNLGVSYRNRVHGEPTENLELAIYHYKQALEFLTREMLPEKWATTQQNLGNAYLGRILGERVTNLNQAVNHYQQAQSVFTREIYPEQWLLIQAGLATAFKELDSSHHKIPDKQVAEIRDTEPPILSKSNIEGVKIYHDKKHSFEIDIPETWSPRPATVYKLAGVLYGPSSPNANKDVFQYGDFDEAFNFEIGPLFPEPLLDDTEIEFGLYARDRGFADLRFGRIVVAGKEHVCASYFINDNMGKRWNKKYMIVFGGMEYTITGTCNDPHYFMTREKEWNAIVQSFRLLKVVDDSANFSYKAERLRDKRREIVQERMDMRDMTGDLYARAYEAVAIGNYKEARLLLENCLRDDPGHILAHKELAVVLKKRNDIKGAIRHRSDVKRLAPVDVVNRANLAELLAGSGKRREALQEVREILTLTPDHPKLRELEEKLVQFRFADYRLMFFSSLICLLLTDISFFFPKYIAITNVGCMSLLMLMPTWVIWTSGPWVGIPRTVSGLIAGILYLFFLINAW